MTMQHPESYPNTQRGATRQTRLRPNPVPMLREMMAAVSNPHSFEDRQSVKDQFIQFLNTSAGAQYRETIYEYWFKNFYGYLLNSEFPESDSESLHNKREKRKAEKEKTTAAMKAKVEEAIKQKAQIILLDWVLPNDKALRDCTGRECRQMSRTVGTWLQKIADRVKPTEIVGNVLQESDVRKLFPAGAGK
jgi:hypothetical protein